MNVFHHLSASGKVARADMDLGVHCHHFALKREKILEMSVQSHKPIQCLLWNHQIQI